MLQRHAARLAAAALIVVGVLFAATAPAFARNGVEIGAFAYTDETGTVVTDLGDPGALPETPEFVVLNIGNGSSNDVGHLDVVAQDAMTRGVKVYGYVHIIDSFDEDSDSNTTEFRTDTKVAEDIGRWVNPFNPQRSNYSRMVDGIMFDQVPNTCGTSNANTLWMSYLSGIVDSQFSFWSYPTPLVMANVGTAVDACQPGYGNYGRVPDSYITFEGDYSTYVSSYLGGNIIDSGPVYADGNFYFPEKFVHIVYDVDSADVKNVLRLGDQRGAHSMFVTDDVLANPYDAAPSYFAQSITDARVSPATFEDGWSGGSGYGNGATEVGFGTAYDGGGAVTSQQVFTQDGGGPGVPAATSPWVARILEIAEDECGVGPSDAEWGDVGSLVDSDTGSPNYYPTLSGLGTIDSDFVGCMHDLFVDNSSGQPNEPMAYICNDYVTGITPVSTARDCRNPDGSDVSDENVNEAATAYFRDAMDDPADVGRMLELIRDRLVEDDTSGDCATGAANRRCIRIFNTGSFNLVSVLVFSNDPTIVAATGGTVNWSAGYIGVPDP